MLYRKATPEDDDVLVRHYLAIWESYGTPADHFRADAEAVIGQFLEEGRRDRALASFIALDGEIAAGSASCQLHQMPYPAALKSEHLLQGYVWSLFVDPAYRRQGVSKKLMSMILDHLRDVGCTGIVLHSSEAGEALYRSFGFEIAREMRLTF